MLNIDVPATKKRLIAPFQSPAIQTTFDSFSEIEADAVSSEKLKVQFKLSTETCAEILIPDKFNSTTVYMECLKSALEIYLQNQIASEYSSKPKVVFGNLISSRQGRFSFHPQCSIDCELELDDLWCFSTSDRFKPAFFAKSVEHSWRKNNQIELKFLHKLPFKRSLVYAIRLFNASSEFSMIGIIF